MLKIFIASFMFLITTSFAQTKTIIFGTEATYPPFESLDSSGKMQGFDIDIANAICTKLQVKCQILNQAFDSLIPALQLNKIDAIIAAMNITAERAKQVDFTNPYYLNAAVIVAPKNKKLNLTPESLQGKIIGVQSGTTFGPYLQNQYNNKVKVQTYASEESTFLDLTAGRIDAVMGDEPLILQWLKKNNQDYEIIGKPIADKNYFGQGYGIAVKKGNTALLQQLNKAIADIKADGTYEKIIKKNFG